MSIIPFLKGKSEENDMPDYSFLRDNDIYCAECQKPIRPGDRATQIISGPVVRDVEPGENAIEISDYHFLHEKCFLNKLR